jgi:hypothetical protein
VEDGVIDTCPVCRRSLGLADRNGRHVASEAHYPRHDAAGVAVCSPPPPSPRHHRPASTSAGALALRQRTYELALRRPHS